jgi:hypothetical protein
MSVQQQATIPASPREVYAILADAGALCALSAMGGEAGSAEGEQFSAFNGAICGRQVELVPGARMVQAWRFARWAPGDLHNRALHLGGHPRRRARRGR